MRLTFKLEGPNFVDELCLGHEMVITIGRSSKSDHSILDKTISKQHCQIVYRDNTLEVRDLESKNGTYVNGIRVFRSPVTINDVIKVGKTKISLIKEKSDERAIEMLKSHQASLQKIVPPLKLDFTSINLAIEKAQSEKVVTASSHAMNYRESSNESRGIKRKGTNNKILQSLASVIDLILCLFAFSTPLVLLNLLMINEVDWARQNQLLFLLGLETISVGGFIWLNFKSSKSTLGEKFLGIKN